jgi:hypothetical protein
MNSEDQAIKLKLKGLHNSVLLVSCLCVCIPISLFIKASV